MATYTQVQAFIANLYPLAKAEARKRDKWVLPSVCIAQAALETGWGTSPLMTKANAYFGIKATGWSGVVYNSDTLECYDGKTYVNVNACFRAYDCVEDSVKDYYDLITGSSRYSAAVNESNAEKAITAIKNGGYATDPDYVSKIMDIIRCYNLTQYDKFKGDTSKGFLTGVNISRTADALVMYCNPIIEAPTNKWGLEVACDKNGVAICDPVYGKGHMAVPEGGRVYSAHGKAIAYLQNIGKGFKVWVQDGVVYYNHRQHRSVDGENCGRGTDKLIVYRNNSVKRNIWGCEVAVLNGVAVNTPVYGKCNIDIPKGGFVISGHGAAAWWMLKNIKKGVKVSYEGGVVLIK